MNLKKPKFWDYKKPNIYAYLLFPITLSISIFNLLKIKPSIRKSKLKTICIGNIYVGGTGKTSLCIKINEILNKKNIKSCFIKKFYKDQVDEQRLLGKYGKLFTKLNRIDALIEAEKKNYDVAIFDDGLQDKTINYDIKFLCFNNINWVGNGMTFPSGPLRESLNNITKYEHIFLNGNLENLENIKAELFKLNSKINIHVGEYVPSNLEQFNKNERFLVFSGIGNHQTFISMIKKYHLNIVKEIEFPDHHEYSEKEINNILNEGNKLKCTILTTEKDFLRINKINKNEIKILKSELKIQDEDNLLKFII